MKNQYRFMKPPAQLRPPYLDNVALVPGNLLPAIKRWHLLAHEAKPDELLIVLPKADSKQRRTLAAVAMLLRSEGHRVRVVHESQLQSPSLVIVQESLGI